MAQLRMYSIANGTAEFQISTPLIPLTTPFLKYTYIKNIQPFIITQRAVPEDTSHGGVIVVDFGKESVFPVHFGVAAVDDGRLLHPDDSRLDQ